MDLALAVFIKRLQAEKLKLALLRFYQMSPDLLHYTVAMKGL